MQASQLGTSEPAARSGASVFYRFTDDQGRLHVVDSWSQVPEPMRSRTERLEWARPEQTQAPFALPARLDWPSFGVGGVTAMVAVGVWMLARRRFGLAAKLVLSGAAIAVLGTLYLGLLRRQTGQSAALLGSPSALIDDARRAADQVRERHRQQEELLKRIEQEAKH